MNYGKALFGFFIGVAVIGVAGILSFFPFKPEPKLPILSPVIKPIEFEPVEIEPVEIETIELEPATIKLETIELIEPIELEPATIMLLPNPEPILIPDPTNPTLTVPEIISFYGFIPFIPPTDITCSFVESKSNEIHQEILNILTPENKKEYLSNHPDSCLAKYKYRQSIFEDLK